MAKPVAGFDENPQNINKKGAPKKDWTVKGLIIKAMEAEKSTGVPYKKAVYDKLVKMADSGDIQAIKEVNQRLDGMPKQTIDATVTTPSPIYDSKSKV